MPCQLAITSISLGRSAAGHDFVHKMNMAQSYGYKGIELFHDDLAAVARTLPGGLIKSNELEAARTIHLICQQRGIKVICLQPFWHYEGLADRKEHEAQIEKLKFWFRIAKALGTDLIQIPSNFRPASLLSDDRQLAIQDLQEAADLGLAHDPPFRFVYEALAWGTHCDTWERSWEIVQEVNRPNFGLCLDTFNIAARAWADPTSPMGRNERADEMLSQSLVRMIETVDVSKVYCVQVVDAERLASPLVPGHEFHNDAQPPRMSWSRNCRLFYGESNRGAFLPIKRIARAVFEELGYEGWVSMELFHRRMADVDPNVPRELAARGAVSWKKLIRDVDVKAAIMPKHRRAATRARWQIRWRRTLRRIHY
ncbi:xylose isomerase-like TIM barrel [Cordyceps militaris]|uniref:Xylose isomerase-like TIM barrel n=1 Tax=Cordyceps militaris TaxID=73501 RepID=A0A2H4SPX8_CORMI|nr:xylose isomerase-like TIM barrel [Cordyceps militaris]